MSQSALDCSHGAFEALYAFIVRVSLLLLEYNVDAITAAISLRECVEAGDSVLSRKQGIAMAQNHVPFPPATEDSRHVQ